MLEIKLQIPKPGEEFCPIPVFLHVFEENRPQVVAVNAPSGYGKSALLAAEARTCGQQVRWYCMDETDNEPENFLNCMEYLCASMENATLNENPHGEDAKRILAVAEWLKSCGQSLFFVFDNLDVITDSTVCGYLDMLVRYSGVHMVFVSGKHLPGWLLRYLLNREGALIGQEQLKLSATDAERLYGTLLPEEVIRAVTEDFCGWPLGVVRTLEYLKDNPALVVLPPDWRRIRTETLLEDYFDRIFQDGYCETERMLLAQTALFDAFDWALCRELMPETTEKLFRGLMRKNPFVRQSGERCSYGAAYRSYLEQMTDMRARQAIYGRAAAYFRMGNDYTQMADYAVRGAQTEFLRQVLEQQGMALLAQEGQRALEILVPYMETCGAALSPEAAAVMAQHAYFTADYEKMERYLNEADISIGKENCYSSYRSLYKALLKYDEEPEKYAKQIRHELFFLNEIGARLPYLGAREKKKLEEVSSSVSACRLRVRSFGSFQVSVIEDGHELSWRTRKGCELFAYLMDIGKPIERGQLIEVLWSDEIPQNAVAMLHNMLYNIRKELSDYRLEGILAYQGRRYRINRDALEWDVDEVRSAAKLVEAHKGEALWQNRGLFDSYWGRYLENIDAEWAQERQRYYDEIYRQGCELLAEEAERLGEMETAIRYCQNILAVEPYEERICAKLLALYGRQKDWRRVRSLYSAFETRLMNDLGIRPGKELELVYRGFGLQK